MSYDFQALYQSYLESTGPEGDFGPPTLEGFIDSTIGLINNDIDDNVDVNPEYIFILDYYDKNVKDITPSS